MILTLLLEVQKRPKQPVVDEDVAADGAVADAVAEAVEVENHLQEQVQKKQEEGLQRDMKILMKIILKKRLCQEKEVELLHEKRYSYYVILIALHHYVISFHLILRNFRFPHRLQKMKK